MSGVQVLAHWKQQGHKALLFTQTQQMLDIVERAVHSADYRHAGLLPAELSGALIANILWPADIRSLSMLSSAVERCAVLFMDCSNVWTTEGH